MFALEACGLNIFVVLSTLTALIYGIVSIFNPEAAWDFSMSWASWRYREYPEASDEGLKWQRIRGVALIVTFAVLWAALIYFHVFPFA